MLSESMIFSIIYTWSLILILFAGFNTIRVWQYNHLCFRFMVLFFLTASLILFYGMKVKAILFLGDEISRGILFEHNRLLPLNAFLLSIITLYLIFIHFREIRWRRTHLSDMSISESINNLPTGICCYQENGAVIAANQVMDDLSRELTEKAIQSGEHLWNNLCESSVIKGEQIEKKENMLLIKSPSEKIWKISKYEVIIENRLCHELIASDITAEYQVINSLKNENEKIEKLIKHMLEYSENMNDLIREKEILATNSRIHDNMNWILLSTVHAIEDGAPLEERQRIIKDWKENVLLLKGREKTKMTEDPFKDLKMAAEYIGVSLKIEGEIPVDKQRINTIFVAAGECLTNAVKHASATEMLISIDGNRVSFTNNGRNPETPIQEGGGLGTIRRSMESIGGSMSVETEPIFKLILDF